MLYHYNAIALLCYCIILLYNTHTLNTIQAYIRYIESLNRESTSMCDWTRELSASQDLLGSYCVEDDIQIPSWLTPQSSTDSLFALRDFLLQESLSVVKFA